MHHFAEPLRPPDLHITGLRLWVHGRQFPMADDYWDGNWLQVTVHCAAPGARVWVTGPILHVPEIAHFLRGIEVLHASLQGEATLPCMEPELAVTLTAEGLGHITSSSREIRGRRADQANKLIRHCYGWGAHLSASNFPGAAHYGRCHNS